MLIQIGKFFLIGLFLCLSINPRVQAEEEHSDYYYVLRLHFSEFAYFQQVDRVIAHVGIQAHDIDLNGWANRTYWKDPKNIELQFENNQFESLILLQAREKLAGPLVDYPVVQYEIWFADGSKQSTDIYEISVTSEISYLNQSGKDQQALRSAFYERYLFQAEPIMQTEAILLKFKVTERQQLERWGGQGH